MTKITSLANRPLHDIPTLETERLRLRPYQVSDLDDMEAMWSDTAYVRYIGNRTRTRPDLWKQIQSMIGSWALLGYGYWVIETKDGTFIGEAGFLEGCRDMTPDHIGTPEAGWGIMPAHWGQGYASEALAACLDWRDRALAGNRTVCIIEPDHAVSIKLAEKFSFKKAYHATLGEDEIHVFERLS